MAAEAEIARDARHALGRRGEDLAADFFIRRGYEICTRNWRCRGGELDLVIRKGEELRLIEVKTRMRRGGTIAAHHAVDGRKLARMGIAAARFLAGRPDLPQEAHFDVLTVGFTAADVPVYRWMRDVE